MALSTDDKDLWNEKQRAEEHRDNFLGDDYEEVIRRYTGPSYNRQAAGTAVDFNNHAAQWLALFLPTIASGNPRTRATTTRGGPVAAFAKAGQLATNRNFELTNFKGVVEKMAVDYAFKFTASICTPQPVSGMSDREDPPYRPTSKRLSLRDYGWDPLALEHSECRYQFHRVVRDKADLLKEAEDFPNRGWRPEEIAALGEDNVRRKQRENLSYTFRRGEVEFFEFWIPEITLDSSVTETGKKFVPDAKKGFNGTIFTLGNKGNSIRDPRPFWGPRDGPYVFTGYLYVPDQAVALAPLTITAPQAEEYNITLMALNDRIRKFKIGVATSGQDGLAEKLANFESTGIFNVEVLEDIGKSMMEMRMWGATPEDLTHIQYLWSQLQLASGMNQPQSGHITGGTATETSAAMMSSNQRTGGFTEKFVTTCLTPHAKKHFWYLTMDPRSKTMLPEEANGLFIDPETGVPIEQPVLLGGFESADYLEDLDISLDTVSMRYTSEMLAAENSMKRDAWIASFAPMMPQLPWVDWSLEVARKAEEFQDPSFTRVIDVQKAMMMGMLMTQGALMGVGKPMQASSPTPRLGIDVQSTYKAAETPRGFSANARPQGNKAPRAAGTSSNTHSASVTQSTTRKR